MPVRLRDAWRFGCGAALLAHRQVLNETGGFRERLGAGRKHGGAEDLEFLWHASRHAAIEYNGRIQVLHDQPRSIETITTTARQYGRALGLLAGTAGARDGLPLILGYCRHIIRATIVRVARDESRTRQLVHYRAGMSLAVVETIAVFLSATLAEPRGGVLCRLCRRHA